MTEVQVWHWIATGTLTILLGILSWWGKGMSEDMKSKLSKEEFKSYLDDAALSRRELRESILKLFEKMEGHEKLDSARFELLTKDFNGGLANLRDILYTSKLEIFEKINAKADK